MTVTVSVVVPVKHNVHPDLLPSLYHQEGISWEYIPIRGEMPIGEARQRGVDRANGKYIAFVDADCVLSHQRWLELMVNRITGNIAMTWAPGRIPPMCSWANRYALQTHPLSEPPAIISRENYVPVGTGHCVIRRDVINEIGGFQRLDAAEDIDLTRRIVDAGYLLQFVPIGVYHYHVSSLHEYYRKYYRNIKAGRNNTMWKAEYLEKRPPLVDMFFSSPRFAVSRAIEERDPRWMLHPLITGLKIPVAMAAMIA